MTGQDNLRNRIAWSLYRTSTAGTTDEGTIPTHLAPEAYNMAQAIIDELGLTTETHAATHAKRSMTRITGAWEWEKQ